MEDFLDKYTVKEFLEWLQNEPLDKYIIPKTVPTEEGDDTVVISMADIESLKEEFIAQVRRYAVFVRGNRFYIHDNKSCQDIMSWVFTEADRDKFQAVADNVCSQLNNGSLSFISHKKPCW